jgi:sodium transport system permease protein
MNWTNVKLILSREIRDQLRDRRTLFMIVVLPMLLYPLLGMSFFQLAQFMQERSTTVRVVGASNLPEQPPLIENNRFASQYFADPAQARLLELDFVRSDPRNGEAEDRQLREAARRDVQAGKYDVAVYFPPNFARRLELFRQAIRERRPDGEPREGNNVLAMEEELKLPLPRTEIFYSTASEKSQIAFARLNDVLRRWTEDVGRTNLKASGMPVSVARPFDLAPADVAEQSGLRGAALWAKVLPVLLLLWAMTGAFYPAVDLCAGEKERGTLETLLCSPAERSEIVIGKLVTVMVFSAVTAVLNLISMGITGSLVMGQLAQFGPPPALAAVWLLLALLPVAALFSALCVALSAFARSTKEGQYYLMPLLLVTMPLVVLPMAPGVELNLGNSLIPVTGLVLLLRALLEGNYWQAVQFLPPVLAVTLGACLLSIRWAVEQFNSESVLFRESERIDVSLWLRHLMQDRHQTPTVAGAFFCGVLILLIRFFMNFALPQPAGFHGFALLAVATQLAVILTPALLMTVMLTSSPRQTLLLRWPAWRALPTAVALAVVLHPIARMLQAAVMYLYPVSDEVKQALGGLDGLFRDPPFWQIVLVIAVAPAICEELAFRGFILSGFRHLGHKWRAIFYSALFFGISHTLLQQSIIATIVGVVIAYLAVQSGSILPGMLFHLVHNSLQVAMTRVTPETLKQLLDRWPDLSYLFTVGPEGDLTFSWLVVTLCAIASMLLLWQFHRLRYAKTEEEERQDAIARAAQIEEEETTEEEGLRTKD